MTWASIAAGLQIALMVLKWWFGLDDAKKEKAKELLKEVPNAKDTVSITRLLDAINRL
jgi:uncharacterized membrane protein SirB2